MNDKQASAETGWFDAWAEMQRKYWDAWSGFGHRTALDKAEEAFESSAGLWTQNIDFWSKLMTSSMPLETRSWTDKLLEVSKGYLQLGEALYKAATQEGGKDFGRWWEIVSESLTKTQEKSGAGFGVGKDPWSGFANLWGLPLDTWKRLSTACSMLPGDMEKAFRDVGGSALVGDWLSTPTLGYTRESQEEAQRLGQLWLAHGQAAQAYAAVLSKVIARAGELLREQVLGQMGKGQTFDSLRACYDLWVDCGEEAYAEISVTDEFTSAQARLTNSLMAVKRQEQKMVDEALGAMNMPTRRELDTSHRRLHQLQRQVWRMQRALDESGAAELREEVAALQRHLSQLTENIAQAAPPSTTPARRSAKPKIAT